MSDIHNRVRGETENHPDIKPGSANLFAVIVVIMVIIICGGLVACVWIHFKFEENEWKKIMGILSSDSEMADIGSVLRELKDERDSYRRQFTIALKEKDGGDNQVAALTRVVQDQHRDLAEVRAYAVRIKKERNQLKTEIADLKSELEKERSARVAAESERDANQEAVDSLRKAGIPFDIGGGKKIPMIDAVITAYKKKVNLVVLNVGKDNGVESGYYFTIFNEGNFIAQVEVEKVMPKLCGCRIIFSTGEIEEGMAATTRLY